MTTVNVVYVGPKLFALDNVARSGKTWEGKGTVQAVTPAQAKRLIAYKDQWALENPKDLDTVSTPSVIHSTDEDGKPTTVEAEEITGPLERMTSTQLVAFAKEKYGKKLRPNAGRKVLLDEVTDIVKHNDAIA